MTLLPLLLILSRSWRTLMFSISFHLYLNTMHETYPREAKKKKKTRTNTFDNESAVFH